MNEEWRTVMDCNAYEVSSLGRFRRRTSSGKYKAGHIVNPSTFKTGYSTITLARKMRLAHRVVAAAFLGPCPDGYQVNHKNGDKRDNRPENLEYVTNSDNLRHRYRVLGTLPTRGTRVAGSKLDEEKVVFVRTLLRRGYQGKDIAFLLSVSPATVCMIGTGETWKHVKDEVTHG